MRNPNGMSVEDRDEAFDQHRERMCDHDLEVSLRVEPAVAPPPGAHAFTPDGRFVSGDGYGGERM